MARFRGWKAGLIAALALTLLAGCAALLPVCSMPDIRPPHISIDATIWLRLHPGGTIHACYAGSCDNEDGTRPTFEVLVPGTVDLQKEHELVVTLTDPAGTTTETTSIALKLVPGQKDAACPMPDQSSRQILIQKDGQLQPGGADDGHIIVPAPEETSES